MLDQKILKSSLSVTSSPESVDGAERSSSQDGVQTDLFGQEVPHASHSLQPGKEKEKTTSDISGQSSLISSASASLQQSLESKLRQLSDSDGSTIYKLTLKRKDTPQGRSYFHLAASVPRIKERDSSSWPTPKAKEVTEDYDQYIKRMKSSRHAKNRGKTEPASVSMAAQLTYWLTPTTSDTNGVRQPDGKRGLGLNTQAQTAWPTPAARDGKGVSGPGRQEKKGNPSDTVPNAAATVPWPTPRAGDGGRNSRTPEGAERELVRKNLKPEDLNQAIRLAAVPWATPNTMDHMKQRSDEALARAKQKAGCSNLKDQIPYSGEAQKSSTAETENIAPSQLNPRFSLWLMGYPIEWAYCAERVTPSSRKRRQKS